MTFTPIPARHMLCRAALIVSLLIVSSTAVTGMSNAAMLTHASTDTAPAPTVTRVLPSDRAILLLEGRDPANAGLRAVLAQGAETDPASETDINYCVPCGILA